MPRMTPAQAAPVPLTHLLYLHGFRSSPQSVKARMMAAHMAQHNPQVHWWCPQLPPSPHEAMEIILNGVADWPQNSMAVVGSSLGGFYATALAEHASCRAVLLNPAVDPARDLAKYIGEQTSWHEPQARFFFQPGFVQELRRLTRHGLGHPDHYLAVIAQGDEVLDWRDMVGRYAGVKIRLLPGSDHALSDFAEHMPEIMAFLGLR
jgi:uncharacterized protein